MKIITISGIDGSGKTSQIKKLASFFQSQGKKVDFFHLVNFSLANKLLSLRKKKKNHSQISASSNKILLRKIAFIIDAIRFRLFYWKISKKIDFLLSDRFFYDQAINIFFLEKKDRIEEKPLWLKIAEIFLPSSIQSFCLLANPQIAQIRKKDNWQNSEYFEKKNKLFRNTQSFWKISFVDANQNQEKVFSEIKKQLIY